MAPAERQRFPLLCPDFVVELRSVSDDPRALMDKMREYQVNGARLGWLLDPSTRTVWVYHPEGEHPPEMLADPKQVAGDPVRPGFFLVVDDVWRAPHL